MRVKRRARWAALGAAGIASLGAGGLADAGATPAGATPTGPSAAPTTSHHGPGPFESAVAAGYVSANGTVSRAFGGAGITKPGTGAYRIDLTGLVDPCHPDFTGVSAQITVLNSNGNVSPGFGRAGYQSSGCPSGSLELYVRTADRSGNPIDRNFRFVVFASTPGRTTAETRTSPLTRGCPPIVPSMGVCAGR